MRLGEILLASGELTKAKLDRALARQTRHGWRLGSHLLDLGFVDEERLGSALARQLKVPAATAKHLAAIDATVLQLVPGQVAARLGVVPVKREGRRLWLAMRDPGAVDDAARALNVATSDVRVLVVPERTLAVALERHYAVLRPAPIDEVIEVDLSEMVEVRPPPIPVAVFDRHAAGSAFMEAVTQFLDQVEMPGATGPLSLTDLSWRLGSALHEMLVVELAVRFLLPQSQRVLALRLESGWLRGWGTLGPELDCAPEGPIEACLQTGEAARVVLHPITLGPLAAPLAVDKDVAAGLVPINYAGMPEGILVAVGFAGDDDLTALARKIDLALQLCRIRARLLA